MTKIPKDPMSSTPPISNTKSDDWQHSSMFSPNSVVGDVNTADKQNGSWAENFVDAAVNWCAKTSGSLTMAEVVRQIAKGCSIKFIAVIGLTGAGKSTVIRNLTGKDVYIEHGIAAGTTSFAMFPVIIEDQSYVLIDTPGFNDSHPSGHDTDVFLEILSWFRSMTPFCDLAGVLYVHDIIPSRFTAAASMNLELLQALCGEEYFRNITILTTMWRKLSVDASEEAEETQKEFEEGPWKSMIERGARVFQHREGVVEPRTRAGITDPRKIARLEGQRKKARRELQKIVVYYEKSESIRPQIQREIRTKVSIFETKAGQVLTKAWGENGRPSKPPPPPTSWWDSLVKVVWWFWPRWRSSSSRQKMGNCG